MTEMKFINNIIFFGGMASGKTAMADFLVNEKGYNKTSFAQPMRELVEKIHWKEMISSGGNTLFLKPHSLNQVIAECVGQYTPLTDKEWIALREGLYEMADTIPNESPKPRKRLQFIGTEIGRNRVRESLWVDVTYGRCASDWSKPWVIDDGRFQNEHEEFNQRGFTPILCDVTESIQNWRMKSLYGKYDPTILQHESETARKNLKFDYKLNTNSSVLDVAYKELEEFLRKEKIS